MVQVKKKNTLTVLPLRDIVIYPGNILPLFVGRIKSLQTLEQVVQGSKELLTIVQKNPQQEIPNLNEMYKVGTRSTIIQAMTLPDGMIKVIVGGEERVKVEKFQMNQDIITASYSPFPVGSLDKSTNAAYNKLLTEALDRLVHVKKELVQDIISLIQKTKKADVMAFLIAQLLDWGMAERQKLLEESNTFDMIETVLKRVNYEVDVSHIEKNIKVRVKEQMYKSQREYYLNEQMKAIQQELGQDSSSEVDVLEKKINESGMSEEAMKKANSELKKLRTMPPISSESTVVRNYLEWLVDVPWKPKQQKKISLSTVRKILDRDHYGLNQVKDRILEYLAVQLRSKNTMSGSILCLVGPPGVGKTSLAASIAKAVGRDYIRMSLGGVRDEAEIRGHRKTYIGAIPGRIIQGMKKAGSTTPLFLLDEIDKIGADWRGDPSSALLEVLDPEQNKAFNDHYLEVDYDLSKVFFMATANSYNIPIPLLDRMEVIPISGYTEDEKVNIAVKYLWPKQVKKNALTPTEIRISKPAILDIIRYYTREAGVREIERLLAKVSRRTLRSILEKHVVAPVWVQPKNLLDLLGPAKFLQSFTEKKSEVGIVTGLAWTSVGGDVLSIECVLVPGKGRITNTGQLGDVMKESITAAEYYIKSHLNDLGIIPSLLENHDIHVHVPEGATPKDGPSAGITMVTAMVSALTNIPVYHSVAMTGEVTLHGAILPIGGLKEKLLAAMRYDIKTVMIPQQNEKDLYDLPKNLYKSLTIIPIRHVKEIFPIALKDPLKPLHFLDYKSSMTVHT